MPIDAVRRRRAAELAWRCIVGAALGIALWCMLYAFQLLPGATADTTGVTLFLALGAILGCLPWGPTVLHALVGVGALVVAIVTLTPLSAAVGVRWVRADPMPPGGVQAIVALSANVNSNGTIGAEGADHLITALELARAGLSRDVVTTSIEEAFPTGAVTSESDQARLVALFGAGIRWQHTPPTASTRDEALQAARLLRPQGVRRVAVVASPLHTRRACATFESVGFIVTCVPSRNRTPGGAAPPPWPRDRLATFGDWTYELLATAKYRSRGWLASPPP